MEGEDSDIGDLEDHYRTPLKCLGLWPLRDSSWMHWILSCTAILGIGAHIFLMISGIMVRTSEESEMFFLEIMLIGVSISSLTKYLVNLLVGDRLLELVDNLNKMVYVEKGDPLRRLLMKDLRFHRSALKAFLVVVGVTLICFFGNPISKLVLEKRRLLSVDTMWKAEDMSTLTYGLIWLFHVPVEALVPTVIVVYDCTVYSFMGLGTVQLKILRHKYLRINTFIREKESLPYGQYDEIVRQKIAQYVKEHVLIEEFIGSVENAFNIAIFCEFLVIVPVMCIVLMGLIVNPLLSFQSGRNIFILTSNLLGIGGFCFFGNQLTTECEKMREAQYELEWYYCGTPIRKSLYIMMSKSASPLIMTAGNLIPLSNETFLSACQSAFSYFTVVRQLYEDSQ